MTPSTAACDFRNSIARADSAAVMLHAANVIDRFRMIASANEIVDFVVLGPATDDLRAGVKQLGARVLDRFSGFCR